MRLSIPASSKKEKKFCSFRSANEISAIGYSWIDLDDFSVQQAGARCSGLASPSAAVVYVPFGCSANAKAASAAASAPRIPFEQCSLGSSEKERLLQCARSVQVVQPGRCQKGVPTVSI